MKLGAGTYRSSPGMSFHLSSLPVSGATKWAVGGPTLSEGARNPLNLSPLFVNAFCPKEEEAWFASDYGTPALLSTDLTV